MSKASRIKSAEYWPRASRHLPGGVNSNVRLSAPPVFFSRAQGAWMWDVDGNDYVDYLLGQGPSFLGHANATVNQAVHDACRDGMLYGNSHVLEVEAAERICSALGWAEMVRLGLTGTESVQAALRLARAATGRRRFIRFEGHYHGWLDNVLVDAAGTGPASAGQVGAATRRLGGAAVERRGGRRGRAGRAPWPDRRAHHGTHHGQRRHDRTATPAICSASANCAPSTAWCSSSTR